MLANAEYSHFYRSISTTLVGVGDVETILVVLVKVDVAVRIGAIAFRTLLDLKGEIDGLGTLYISRAMGVVAISWAVPKGQIGRQMRAPRSVLNLVPRDTVGDINTLDLEYGEEAAALD